MSSLVKQPLALFILLATNLAFASQDEIIVTGQKLQRYSSDNVPYIVLDKKADYVLVGYQIICDTRDRNKRLSEITDSLNDLIKKAGKRDDIQLSTIIEYEDDYETLYFPIPFEKFDGDLLDAQYGRSDTSKMYVVIKMPVTSAIQSLEQAEELIDRFVDTVSMKGRTEAITDGEVRLSIVNLERYRPELLQKIQADLKSNQATFSGTEVQVSGLENVLRWERVGELDLKVYLPYEISITVK